MGKQERYSIDLIANTLIDKLNGMERTAARIEKVSKEPLKIDAEEIEKIFQARKNEENAILEGLRALQKKNRARLPYWVMVVLSVAFLASIGLSLYAWNKAEGYDMQKARAEHFERLFIESQKKKN